MQFQIVFINEFTS
ncbi:hypothetical protein D046_3489, partial [Vibrio parahaemolyticus V-223/04]